MGLLLLSAWLGGSLHLHPHTELPLQSQFMEPGKHRGPLPTLGHDHSFIPCTSKANPFVEGYGTYSKRRYRSC